MKETSDNFIQLDHVPSTVFYNLLEFSFYDRFKVPREEFATHIQVYKLLFLLSLLDLFNSYVKFPTVIHLKTDQAHLSFPLPDWRSVAISWLRLSSLSACQSWLVSSAPVTVSPTWVWLGKSAVQSWRQQCSPTLVGTSWRCPILSSMQPYSVWRAWHEIFGSGYFCDLSCFNLASKKIIHTSDVWTKKRRSKLSSWGHKETVVSAALGKRTLLLGMTQKQNAHDTSSSWTGQMTAESGVRWRSFLSRLTSGVSLQWCCITTCTLLEATGTVWREAGSSRWRPLGLIPWLAHGSPSLLWLRWGSPSVLSAPR